MLRNYSKKQFSKLKFNIKDLKQEKIESAIINLRIA